MDGFICLHLKIGNHKQNILFVNQGLDKNGYPTFQDRAEIFGIGDSSNSMGAVFLDYDMDGLLDLYVVNNEQSKNTSNYLQNQNI